MILCAINNCFFIPLEINFEFKNIFDNIGYILFDNFIDLLFVADIIVMFFQSYLDNHSGKEVFDPGLVAINYIQSMGFLYDILSVLGASMFTNKLTFLKPFGYIKMIRVRRLGRFIDRQNFDIKTKSVISICKISLYLCLYLHNQTCIWYNYTQKYRYVKYLDETPMEHVHQHMNQKVIKYGPDDENLWYPPYDWLDYTSS
jgi:hypothetical protein